MFGWTAAHIPLFVFLPVLLAASGFFSGSETALFGLTHSERMGLRRKSTVAARAIESLLARPRLLLITILSGNMTVNVLYFVISSVLLIEASEAHWLAQGTFGLASLLGIILLGEVLPKLVANSARPTVASAVAPLLLALHRVITPVRSILDTLVVSPLSRLTAPSAKPPALDAEELAALLELSGHEGVISDDERAILNEVILLGGLRVKDVMTPRVRMQAVPRDATRDDVMDLARQTRLTRFPVYDGDLDHIIGTLHVKRFLLSDPGPDATVRFAAVPARYVPEVATLDRLLEDFRRQSTQVAIVVDEFGGTAGIVALEDIVRRIAGDLWNPDGSEVATA